MVTNGAKKPGNFVDMALGGVSLGVVTSRQQVVSGAKRTTEKTYNKGMRVIAGAYYKSRQD